MDEAERGFREAGWELSFNHYDPAQEGYREAALALGNGVFVTRAAPADAGRDGTHYPGTYHAGCYNRLPSEIAGERDDTESLVNLPNWLPLLFRIADGPWWRLDALEILSYSHSLDLRTGIARRELLAADGAGRRTLISEQRLVSMAQPHVSALQLVLTPQNWSGRVEIQAALDGDVVNANVRRYEDYASRHLSALACHVLSGTEAALTACTSHSRIAIALAMRTTLSTAQAGPGPGPQTLVRAPDWIAHRLETHAEAGSPLVIGKTVAQYTSCDPAGAQALPAAQAELQACGDFSALRRKHAAAWEALWQRAAIETGNPQVCRALRFHAFHLLQTVSPHTAALDAGIPARGWHGEIYHGHVFWDELFVMPFLHFRFPELARAMLLYRYRRLDAARAAARASGYRGAMYPWRSASDGREVTPRHQKNLLTGEWTRDHTYLQRHIGAGVAFNIWQYAMATGDDAFLHGQGAEMLLEIARFWASITRPAAQGGRYEIRGVMGPDEYHTGYPQCPHPGLDNNAYTNLMAVWTLCRALEVLDRMPAPRRRELRRQLALGDDELAQWERISRRMAICFHGNGIISQFEGFAQLQELPARLLPGHLAAERRDWALQAIGQEPNAYQAIKQADVLALFHLLPEEEVTALLDRLGYAFGREDLRRTAAYYLARSAHDSSLSRMVYAGALATAEPELSQQLYLQALDTDRDPLRGESVAEGIHLGVMGGSIDILQRRYLGLCPRPEGLHLSPALPAILGAVGLTLQYRGNTLEIEADASAEAPYLRLRSLPSNRSATVLVHAGKKSVLQPGKSAAFAIGQPGRPPQPAGAESPGAGQ